MGLVFHLHNNDLASYRWGSLISHYSPFAHVNTRTLPETLASSVAGVANWTTEAEFRKTVGFTHESIHYLQDVTTGVGYWDYLVMRENMRNILSGAMRLTWIPTLMPPYNVVPANDPELADFFAEAQAGATTAADRLLFIPRDYLPPAKTDQLRNILATAFRVPEVSEEHMRPVLVDALLESEAMLAVFSEIDNLKASDNQWAIANQNDTLWNFYKMKEEYFETFSLFYHAIAPADPPEGQAQKFLDATVVLLPHFITLACAHPSPRLLQKHNAAASDYYPGVKFARLVKSFQAFSNAEDTTFLRTIADHDAAKAEQMLLQHCAFPYLTSQEVYEDWLALFTELAKDDDDRILRIRKQGCETALTKPAECARKRLYLLVDEKLPLFYYSREGMESYGFAYEHFDHDQQVMYFADLMRHNRDLSLAEYFFESGKFICPFADGKLCAAATPECRTGIRNMSSLPHSEDCRVRSGLTQAGFKLEG